MGAWLCTMHYLWEEGKKEGRNTEERMTKNREGKRARKEEGESTLKSLMSTIPLTFGPIENKLTVLSNDTHSWDKQFTGHTGSGELKSV